MNAQFIRSIVGISLIDFIIANGPRDRIYIDLEINNQHNIEKFLELQNKLKPLCNNFVDFGNYFSENIELN